MEKKALLSVGNITLITGDRTFIAHRTQQIIVAAALRGPVKLLIGGNRYDHYGVNYAIAAATPEYEHILREHIFLSRAETCYQMVELLMLTRSDEKPTIILDLLATFYDDSVPDREINALMAEATAQIRRLSRQAAVVISSRSSETRTALIHVLARLARRIETPPAPTSGDPVLQNRLIE